MLRSVGFSLIEKRLDLRGEVISVARLDSR